MVFKNRLLSVIMPIYNRTDLLINSIESVLSQSFTDFELLLIMDGSPQETRDIVMSYKHHPKVRIFETDEQTGNACIPRNIGITEAYGDVIVLQDSDDVSLPGRLQEVYNEIVVNDRDFIYGDYLLLYNDTDEIKECQAKQCDLERMLVRGNHICQATVAFKKEIAVEVGGFKRRMYYMEDYEFWVRLLWKGYRLVHVPKQLAVYRVHEGNLEKKIKDDKWKDELVKEYKIIPKQIDLCDYKEIKL